MLKNFTANDLTNVAAQPPSQFETISCVYFEDRHLFENFPSNPKSIYYVENQNQQKIGKGHNPTFITLHGRTIQIFLGVIKELDLVIPTCNLDQTNHQDFRSKFKNHLKSNLPIGALPSDTQNRRVSSKEHCKAVTLRSGKTLKPKVVEIEDGFVDKEEVQLQVKLPLHKS
ncbi:hypothetical protein EPI10_005949 [Gossypium australe]|uniref:Uncharacterized protein n=1 Tax=Gossypium australe TaxID=47621 RepID=A0A5B6WPS6_9ROSI|nr:hypothetical protein EPI10_005949 [Gossypium australe]